MMSAREAMERAIERAESGRLDDAKLWLGIATELRHGEWMTASIKGVTLAAEPKDPEWIGSPPPHDSGALVRLPVPEPTHRRAETEVLWRVRDESTPAYEAAGESLENTALIEPRVALPAGDVAGPNSTCSVTGCGLPLVWIPRLGWVHDIPGHPVSCDVAKEAGESAC